MSERLIAIGDIHGCHVALEKLLEVVAPASEDTVVVLGDCVDRGPDSKRVVDLLIDLGRRTELVCLMGNHEEMMLQVIRDEQPHHHWLRYGGLQTLESYEFSGDLEFLPEEHDRFFNSLVEYHIQGDFFFTHAAYDPGAPLDQQPVEFLRWHSLTEGIPSPHPSGRTAVVGHTANRDGEILDLGHLICLDTYCYGGGWLTAMDLGSRKVWQASQAGELR